MLWRRLAATLIDVVVTAFSVLSFLGLTLYITFLFVPPGERPFLSALAVEGLILIWVGCVLFCPTVGLRMMDLQVVRSADGTRPSLARRALRSSIIVLTGPVGLAVMFFDPGRRTLWDLLSRTQVTEWEWEEAQEQAEPDVRAMLRRLAAYLVDVIILGVLVIPTVFAAGAYKNDDAFSLIWICHSIAYFTLFVPTAGHRLLKLRGVTTDGKPVGVLRRLARGFMLGGLFFNFGTAFLQLLTTVLMLASKQYLTPWDYVSRLRFVRETRMRKGATDEKPVSDTGGEWLENVSPSGRGL